jgi:hypothetical protein
MAPPGCAAGDWFRYPVPGERHPEDPDRAPAARRPVTGLERALSQRSASINAMSHPLAGGQLPVVPLPEREPAALRAAVARLDPAALAKFEADWTAATAMSTRCFPRGTSSSTGSAGSQSNAGLSSRHACAPASASSPSHQTARNAGRPQPRSATSCSRPRQPLHERLDVGVRPGRRLCGERTHPPSDRR